MRIFIFFFLFLFASAFVDDLNYDIDLFDTNEIPDIGETHNFIEGTPDEIPKTAASMMARFNDNFMHVLASKDKIKWTKLMEVMSPNAYIETCMGSFGISIDQFHKWISYLNSYYVQVGLASTKMTHYSSIDVSTELIYHTEIRGGEKGFDKWSMTATFDSEKGHFVITTLHMLSDCKIIPINPPLEPAIPAETFIASLRTKLVDDIFLNEGLHYKSAYESMYDYLSPDAVVDICDVGKMNAVQFVEYWYKRFGKIQVYMDHAFNNFHDGNKVWSVDFGVTYQSEPGALFRDKYRFTVQKYLHLDNGYFENFHDWKITKVRQNCTENKTKMSKSDEAEAKMSLASRRWDQMYNRVIEWDTLQAFLEMFDQKTFHGYACGGKKLPTFESFVSWLSVMRGQFQSSTPKQTYVYDYKDEKIGFYVINQLTAHDNITSTHKTYFEGFYKDNNWQLNHLGFACAD